VENVGKIKMVNDWKKIERGKVPILMFLKKKNKKQKTFRVQLFPGPSASPKGKV